MMSLNNGAKILRIILITIENKQKINNTVLKFKITNKIIKLVTTFYTGIRLTKQSRPKFNFSITTVAYTNRLDEVCRR